MQYEAITLQNIVKTYKNFEAVKGISLTVNQGDIYGFLGPNGAGKSTTLRMMLGLIAPTSGAIHYWGKPFKQNAFDILNKVGCIVEKPDFYLHLSAIQNLKLLGSLNQADISKKNLYKTLELVGLAQRENHKVATFSHGMKQRLGIAQCLLHNPDLILLDEPTTGLDPQGIIDIRNLIIRLQQEHNKTIVLSSHILTEIQAIATRMVIINKGEKIVEGTVDELLNNENLSVEIECDHPLQAQQMLLDKRIHTSLFGNSSIQFNCNRTEIPAINALLVNNSITVFQIKYVRSLEQLFLKLTQNGQNK